MLQQRLTTCSECNDISDLLEKISCKIAKLGANLYGNITFMLDKPVPAVTFYDLLMYKRILTYKQINPDYCKEYTIEEISSRVNILIHK